MRLLAHCTPLAVAAGIATLSVPLPSVAQGALKPIDALVVNPESRPVPVSDKALFEAAQAIYAATRVLTLAAGHAPYQQSVSTVSCSTHVCTAQFAPVPSGKRLVITHASAQFGLPAGNLYPSVELSDASRSSGRLLLPAPQSTGPGTFIASSPVTFYVESGRSPALLLGGNNAGFSTITPTATVVGYLIDAVP